MGRVKTRSKMSYPLSTDGMKQLADDLRQYRDRLQMANDRFVERLAEIGLECAKVVLMTTNGGDADKPIGMFEVIPMGMGEYFHVVIRLTGEQVLFYEFGAGKYYNEGNRHPLATEFGYGVGTYPNQKYAFHKGWNYEGNDGNYHFTRGTEAGMPMYKASVEMRTKIMDVAKEVFQSVI